MNKAQQSLIDSIGGTPMVKLQELSDIYNTNVYAKLESSNPGLSVKDRTVLNMIEHAEREGKLEKGVSTLVEATSGNTGFSLAMICAIKGYKCVVCVKDKASTEKINAIKALGAKVVLCPSVVKADNPRSYYRTAETLSKLIPDAYYINQNYNLNNLGAHYATTGPEIWEQTEGNITHFISSASTGGPISGISKFLKEKNEDIDVTAVDSEGSVLKHFHETGEYDTSLKRKTMLEGVGKDIIPPNVLMDNIDRFIQISDKESIKNILHLAKKEGIMAGGSCGATIEGLKAIAPGLNKNHTVVLLFSDHGSKYLSKFYDFDWQKENGYSNEKEDELTTVINEFYFNNNNK
jgi:cystathionine beta-synthase